MRTTLSLSLLVSALSLAGCAGWSAQAEAPAPEAQKTGLAPQAARITDERILADRKTLEAVQQRLRALNEAGVPQNHYPLAKAQCEVKDLPGKPGHYALIARLQPQYQLDEMGATFNLISTVRERAGQRAA